jgi:uncharacterized protein YuzE
VKVIYDERTDTLTVVLKETPITDSDEGQPGVVLDYDANGDLVSLEILDASKRVTSTRSVELEVRA